MVIVDTTVWIDYLGGYQTAHSKWLERELKNQRLGITDLILCEILQGIREDHLFDLTRNELLKFKIFSSGGTEMNSLKRSWGYRWFIDEYELQPGDQPRRFHPRETRTIEVTWV